MADYYTLFSEGFEVTGQQAVWLQKAWDAAGVMHGADPEFTALIEGLYNLDEVTLCDLRIHTGEPGQKPKAYLKCEDHCDLEGVAKVLQLFMKTFGLEGRMAIGYAQTCSKMHTGQFGGGIVLVTAQKYVIWGTDELMQFAEAEVARGL